MNTLVLLITQWIAHIWCEIPLPMVQLIDTEQRLQNIHVQLINNEKKNKSERKLYIDPTDEKIKLYIEVYFQPRLGDRILNKSLLPLFIIPQVQINFHRKSERNIFYPYCKGDLKYYWKVT